MIDDLKSSLEHRINYYLEHFNSEDLKVEGALEKADALIKENLAEILSEPEAYGFSSGYICGSTDDGYLAFDWLDDNRFRYLIYINEESETLANVLCELTALLIEKQREPLPKLLTSKELQTYLRASRKTAERFGKNCGAERRVGRKMLFDLETINRALKGGMR